MLESANSCTVEDLREMLPKLLACLLARGIFGLQGTGLRHRVRVLAGDREVLGHAIEAGPKSLQVMIADLARVGLGREEAAGCGVHARAPRQGPEVLAHL